MRPRKPAEVHPENPGGGFEVRVIGAKSPDAGGNAGGGGVEIGLRIGSTPSAAVSVVDDEAPVHRLEADPAGPRVRARPLGSAGPAVVDPARGSRRRHKERKLKLWTLWMAGGTCVLAVATVVAVMSSGRSGRPAGGQELVFAPQVELEDHRETFLKAVPEMTREAESILRRYASATTVDEVEPLVRRPEIVRERLRAHWRPWGSDPAFAAGSAPEATILQEEGRPVLALALTGRKGDFSRFAAIFVRENGAVKLDWEATEGIGEVKIDALRSGSAAVKDALVRAMVSPADFYTPEFPESEYRSYQLLDAAHQEFIWAFAPVDSPAGKALAAEFNEGSLLLEQAGDVRVTLRVSGPVREGVKLFLITEMLHKGWVSP
jgi:hypothetical protein